MLDIPSEDNRIALSVTHSQGQPCQPGIGLARGLRGAALRPPRAG